MSPSLCAGTMMLAGGVTLAVSTGPVACMLRPIHIPTANAAITAAAAIQRKLVMFREVERWTIVGLGAAVICDSMLAHRSRGGCTERGKSRSELTTFCLPLSFASFISANLHTQLVSQQAAGPMQLGFAGAFRHAEHFSRLDV